MRRVASSGLDMVAMAVGWSGLPAAVDRGMSERREVKGGGGQERTLLEGGEGGDGLDEALELVPVGVGGEGAEEDLRVRVRVHHLVLLTPVRAGHVLGWGWSWG